MASKRRFKREKKENDGKRQKGDLVLM